MQKTKISLGRQKRNSPDLSKVPKKNHTLAIVGLAIILSTLIVGLIVLEELINLCAR